MFLKFCSVLLFVALLALLLLGASHGSVACFAGLIAVVLSSLFLTRSRTVSK